MGVLLRMRGGDRVREEDPVEGEEGRDGGLFCYEDMILDGFIEMTTLGKPEFIELIWNRQ